MYKRLPLKSKLPTMPPKPRQDQATSRDLELENTPPPTALTVDELIKSIGGRSSVVNQVPVGPQIDSVQVEPTSANESENVLENLQDGSPSDPANALANLQEDSPSPPTENDSTTDQPSTSGEQTSTDQQFASIEPVKTNQSSFIVSNWPYLLIGATLLYWVLSQFILRREPSFKHTVPQKPKVDETNKLKGQFKKSERFIKPKDKSSGSKKSQGTSNDTASHKDEEAGAPLASSTKEKATDNLAVSVTPTDDEFDLSDAGSDSDVFSVEDAAEIVNSVDAKKKNNSSKRFKTEDDFEEFEITDDEVVSFDDEDSQLSLADSDTEFGFDLDDEESRVFLDSNKLADEEIALAPQDDAEVLADQKPETIAKDVPTVAIEAPAAINDSVAQGSFFSKVFGAKPKPTEEEKFGEVDLDDEENVEFSLDDDDAFQNAVVDSVSENSIAKPVLEEITTDQLKVTDVDSEEDSDEFEFGLFEDEDVESPISIEVDDGDNEPSTVEPVAADGSACAAGSTSTLLTKVASANQSDAVDKIESESQWQAQISMLESENIKLSDQTSTLGSENAKLSDQASTLESENLKLVSQVDELTQQISVATENATQSDTLAQERDELTKTVESLRADKDALLSEKDRITEEFKVVNQQHLALEQERADLLKQNEELAAEKTAAEASVSEMESLQAKIATAEAQHLAFESEIQSLKAKLAEAKPEPASDHADEDTKDLKERFEKRLAAEFRKRKQAEKLVSQAEEQRDEVAALLRSAKADILALKTNSNNEDFVVGN